MKNKSIWIASAFIVIAVILVSLIFFLKSPEKTDSKFSIRIPDTKFMGLLPLYIAEEKGFFNKNNIQIEWVDVKDPGQAEKSFLAGHADLNITTFASSLQAEIRQPGTLSLFIPICETSDKPGSYLLVPKDSKITSTKQLKGKKIGTYSGPSQKAYAQIVLGKLGLKIDQDYEMIQVSSSSQIQALFGGTFDVLFTVEPYGSVAISQGAKVLENGVRTKYINNPFWVGSFVVKKEFTLDKKKMNQFITAIDEAIKYISENETESRAILSSRTNIEKDVASICYLYNWIIKPSDSNIDEMQDLIDLLISEKLLDKNVDISTILYYNDEK